MSTLYKLKLVGNTEYLRPGKRHAIGILTSVVGSSHNLNLSAPGFRTGPSGAAATFPPRPPPLRPVRLR